MVVAFALCSLLATTEDRPTQAYAQAMIAETHIARCEWTKAEEALRYALIFDYDEPFLRARLNHVMAKLGKPITKAVQAKWKRSLRLQKRLLSRVRVEANDRSVAEKP